MSINVVGTILGIVFHHEDRCAVPDGAITDGLHKLANSIVIVGNFGSRRMQT